MLLNDMNARQALPTDLAAVQALLAAEGLEAEFKYHEFVVMEAKGEILACARLKPLPDGTLELASVAVAKEWRGMGLGERIVAAVLKRANAPVYALALAPGFFAKQGFRYLESVPVSLKRKAELHCASKGFVPMVWRAASS
ncbi:MAG: GNAT family N-acetyltransferase [Euryarchaeota archaeon]|nr:GNAT family N-acetyltransferase [Euryarchaeota archaeon]